MGNLICITGPMAAGKNELSLMLEKCGWLHIDADVLAHFAIDNCKEEKSDGESYLTKYQDIF